MVKSRTPPGDVASSADCIVAESNEPSYIKNQLDGSFGHELAESSSLFQSEVTPAENSKRHPSPVKDDSRARRRVRP